MHKVALCLVLFVTLLNFKTAQASDYAGGYFGGKFGVNRTSASGTVNSPSHSTFAYGVQGGYLEGGYNLDVKAVTVGLGAYYDYNAYEQLSSGPQFTSWAYGLNAKFGLPIDDWLLYGKYGYGYSTGTRDLSMVNQRSSNFAFGAEYELVNRWGAVVEYKVDDFSNKDGTIKISNKTLAFGLIYYFDRSDKAKEQAPAPEVDLQPEPYTEVDLGLDTEPPPDIGSSVATTGTAVASDPESWQDLLENKTVIIEGTIFAAGTTVRLRADYIKELEDLAAFARKFPTAKFEIVGYSDNLGSADYNKRLSLAQAETAKNYLVVKGVAADRISAKGKGPEDPIGDNNTPEGRAKNRRLEIIAIIMDQNTLVAAATVPKATSNLAPKSTSVPTPAPASVPVPSPVSVLAPVAAVVPASKPEKVSAIDAEFWDNFMVIKPFVFEGTNFASSTAPSLKSGDHKELDDIAGLAGKYPDSSLELIGFTDSLGSEEYNQNLSLARAKAVKAYLVKQGVASDRITIRGEGAANPVGDNKTNAGRASNRRVEILSVVNNKEVKKTETSSVASSASVSISTTVQATLPIPAPATVTLPAATTTTAAAAAPAPAPAVVKSAPATTPVTVKTPATEVTIASATATTAANAVATTSAATIASTPTTATAIKTETEAKQAPSIVYPPATVPETSPNEDVWTTLMESNPVFIESNHFVAGTIRLKTEADSELDAVADFASKYPEAKLDITGYSNSKTNLALPLGLADSVRNYLVTKGVAGNRITIKGGRPDSAGSEIESRESRAKNRRVEIRAISNEEDKGLVAIPAPIPAPAPESTTLKAEQTSPAVPETWNILLEQKPVLVNIEGTSFESGSGKPSAKVVGELNEVVGFAVKYPDSRLELTGYADSTGSVELNQKLSRDRADSVKEYLVSKGVAASRIVTKGGGSANPIGSNRNKEGRAKNRRVEIHTLTNEQH